MMNEKNLIQPKDPVLLETGITFWLTKQCVSVAILE